MGTREHIPSSNWWTTIAVGALCIGFTVMTTSHKFDTLCASRNSSRADTKDIMITLAQPQLLISEAAYAQAIADIEKTFKPIDC